LKFFIANGRLGNQLFQYAFLNSISNKGEYIICIGMDQLETAFVINNSNFKNIKLNRYLQYLGKRCLPYFFEFLSKLRLVNSVEQLRINDIPQPEVKTSKGILPFFYVKTGFFQTESFFKPESIDFIIRPESEDKAKVILKSLPDEATKIFVHVRRGDYLFESYRGNRGINLPKEYYFNSIALLNTKIENPYYIFLTDDPEYVDCCFQSIKNKYISEENMAVDLALMSLCEYGVASNSSFSWWGAYLMKNRKEVVFPKYWYGWKTKTESHPGIQPSWATTIDVVKKCKY
jgi:hypothetical protein